MIGVKARREDGKEEAAQGRGMAEVVTLASLHQDRRDKKHFCLKVISFNLRGYCYFIIPFEEELEQEWVSFSLLSTNYYFGLILKVLSLCTSAIGAFAFRSYVRVYHHASPPPSFLRADSVEPTHPP